MAHETWQSLEKGGFRALLSVDAGRVVLRSRRGTEMGQSFPEVVGEAVHLPRWSYGTPRAAALFFTSDLNYWALAGPWPGWSSSTCCSGCGCAAGGGTCRSA
jgi:bifunctional non-homologous end joining protein LigD